MLKKFVRDAPTTVLAVLLGLCLFAYYSTREPTNPKTPQSAAMGEQPLVDTTLLQSVMKVAPLAAVSEERVQAQEAWRLADHELDLTFASAIRAAEAENISPPAGPLRQLSEHINELKLRMETDNKHVEELSKKEGPELDRARAQLDLIRTNWTMQSRSSH